MKPPERILFIAEGQLGDVMVITPALRAVKESNKSAFVSILLLYRRKYTETSKFEDAVIRKSPFKGTAEVFLNNPYVDEVLELDRSALRILKGFKRFRAELENIKNLRMHKFDTVICTFPQDRFALYSFLSGARIRIGQKKQGLNFFLNHKPDINQNTFGVLKYFCSLLKPLGLKCNNEDTIFNIPQDDKVSAEKFFRENNLQNSKCVIGIHPGSSQHDRKWLPERFAELINFLKNEAKADVILFYSDYDIPYINEIKKGLKVNIVEAKTKTLSALASLFSMCTLCITHSSGPRHLAAAVGTQTLGIFDKCDDIRWAIYDKTRHPVIKTQVPCAVCPVDRCLGIIPDGEVYSSYCMRDIKTEDVIRKAKEMIGNANK
jgi:ADP-heptose:LPS heptosyltransferase